MARPARQHEEADALPPSGVGFFVVVPTYAFWPDNTRTIGEGPSPGPTSADDDRDSRNRRRWRIPDGKVGEDL